MTTPDGVPAEDDAREFPGDPDAPNAEETALVVVQTALADRPGVLPTARGMSHFGEHSLGWLAIGALGALTSRRHRRDWLTMMVGTFAAHAAAVVIKRVVRRPRPHHPDIAINVGTPSKLSFPSAHATSTTAAALLMARATGSKLPWLVVAPMALSRMVLGVHYPSDVAAGAVVGAGVAAVTARISDRLDGDQR
ncbi:phosphatase PAP2 family protein [Mycolicibacterium brumae]|uniref:Phosphatase PAP2 family protein n=1 Tax=Mycolicibacterium brumae TaxID=85968 RepID=A0A2G5PEH2_9MYCO|nr:phosphatase PAP2 family protein [Mycolicibacterium brumae]MCV7191792.1 phosphatase PAP2 family protein [Mycolicibacterium brumae]PIB76324.1 phosphatase PAP2 family protein [Mycolicibacterium brumae]RWA15832.1 hypothetical protein MBRU_09795 [Mycolicibacterium brumae DSM 44177]UWW07098.1 phosphatase PAP2 family protein [Mycolicibacterium brumae]